jgi:hypothetical protein
LTTLSAVGVPEINKTFSFASNIMKLGFLVEIRVLIKNMKSELGGQLPFLH